MGRLIDADELKSKLQARHDNGNDDFDKGYNIGLGTAIDLIDCAPTIPLPDFKEGYKQAILDGKTNFSRPQGKWIFSRCDNCGAYHNSMYRNFCPNCGADMRGEEE